MVEAAPLQRVVDLSGAVGGDDDMGGVSGSDRPYFGDRDLEIGEDLKKVGLELSIAAIELVNQ